MFLSNSSAAESQPHKSTSLKVTTIPDDPTQPQPTGFRCSFCKGKFRKQQELERHIRILHKPYKCTLCEFAASQEEELIGHVETMHITADSGSGQKTVIGAGDKRKLVGEFSCMVCGQTFSQAWFLKGHMRKHKDSFEHCCQICGRRFKEPWFLKNHMKVHLNKLAGGKIDRCPLSSDYTTAQTASLGFHLDRYHFPHWQNSRDLSSPLQPTSSSSSPNSNPKLRPGSREDWSPSEDHYLGYDSQSENALLMNKQSNLTDKDAEVEGFSPTQTRRSQYEPLDLSLRPESVTSHSAMSPAVSVQVSGVFSNGLSTSITRQLKSYSNAAAELSVKESANFQGPGEKKHDKPEPWRKAGAEYTISSLENLTPGQANHFHYQGGLLSFLRSQGHMSSTPANSHKASLNGVGDVEKDVASAMLPCSQITAITLLGSHSSAGTAPTAPPRRAT
ncbi:uncharacterized protein LOC143322555 [Chaetodon auriga]|uniref:uncharacterized protein LOC143322555 n=1 Tax=Chaetodon auriga TaxID=39042 RepID=UPI004032D68F